MSAKPPRDPPVAGPSRRRIRKQKAARRPPSPDLSSSLDISAYLEQKYQEELAAAADAPPRSPPRRLLDEGIPSPRMRMFEEFQRHVEGSTDWILLVDNYRLAKVPAHYSRAFVQYRKQRAFQYLSIVSMRLAFRCLHG
ncbi:hypothetical protein TNCV_4434861 [Trichonephila clavipes]|nr:hypothetical protein TNCV_4434861 [Trichonephila clavipes]